MRALIAGLLMVVLAGCAAAPSGRLSSAGSSNRLSSAAVEMPRGSSMQDAIVLSGIYNSRDGVAAEREYVERMHPGFHIRDQAVMEANGRVYDRLIVQHTDGRQLEIYFDISDWYGR